MFETASGGRIDVREGAVSLYSGATEAQAGKLMAAYAEAVFDTWASGYPDTFEEAERQADGSRVYAVGNSGRGGY